MQFNFLSMQIHISEQYIDAFTHTHTETPTFVHMYTLFTELCASEVNERSTTFLHINAPQCVCVYKYVQLSVALMSYVFRCCRHHYWCCCCRHCQHYLHDRRCCRGRGFLVAVVSFDVSTNFFFFMHFYPMMKLQISNLNGNYVKASHLISHSISIFFSCFVDDSFSIDYQFTNSNCISCSILRGCCPSDCK